MKSKAPRGSSSESSSSIAGRLPPVLKVGVASSLTYFSICLADAEAEASAADFARDSAYLTRNIIRLTSSSI